ncbi:MAG TPA: hypothetical protein VNQ76_16300 [Planctomicrobium sp.]|nr:hypothetical protein [Planctomicrobium sp.]
MTPPRRRPVRNRHQQYQRSAFQKPLDKSPLQILARRIGELTGDHLARLEGQNSSSPQRTIP